MGEPDVDPRRLIPRTDALLASPEMVAAAASHGADTLREAVRRAQQSARRGEIDPGDVAAAALRSLPVRTSSSTPIINATGVVVHTNIGRAPLSPSAIEAITDAARYVDVELDLSTGRRAPRGRGALDALQRAVPDAQSALVVNNGAAALVLATTALAAGREVIISRGELVEIGDGFRLPDLIESTGARLREVGTTNRTSVGDYAAAIGPQTGCILKVHPSNFRIDGFTSSVGLPDLAALGVPVIMDVGSGLLRADAALPDEPDVTSSLREGATIVTASGDKLLGGPQAGLLFGSAAAIQQLRRHPLARALRVDKLTLAAIEATIRGPVAPVIDYLHSSPEMLQRKASALATACGIDPSAVIAVDGRVGGGGAPGITLAGWAIAIPEECAELLRTGDPAVLARIERGQCLVDPRCVPDDALDELANAVRAAISSLSAPS